MKLLRVSAAEFQYRAARTLTVHVHSECSSLYFPVRSCFSTSVLRPVENRELKKPSQGGHRDEQSRNDIVDQVKEHQRRTPWHREGANLPPVRRQRSAGAMVKGKLLTTPSRLLKLIVPLVTSDHNEDRKTVEPLALVVHSQQPLSYLERLIQSELPVIKNDRGDEKIPAVHFKAANSTEDGLQAEPRPADSDSDEEGLDRTKIDGKIEKTGVVNPTRSHPTPADSRSGLDENGAERYNGQGQEDTSTGPSTEEDDSNFVRWSSSTEIGDFIRDATRGKEFIIEVEGLQKEIRIGVPSFQDRTYYLRQRLRRASRAIADLASIKEECDRDAHRAAQRVAVIGFALLVLWWIGVYYLTFRTNLGWDFMEPITYLVGLSGLMMGYLWFLYNNREVSYRAAMNLTISRRQSQLYAARGFNPERWEELVRDGNALRAEIKAIASEYDVEWDELEDEQDEKVTKALKKERDKHRQKADKEEADEVDAEDTEKEEEEESKVKKKTAEA